MSRGLKLLNFFLGGLLLVLVMYGIETSHADGGHGHHDGGDTDINIGGTEIGGTSVDVGGNSLDIAGDKAFAVGGNSFDVDINDCLASTAWNIVVFGRQTIIENPTCIADGLDARGRHEAAATVRCTHVDTIRDSYSDFETCKTAVTMTAFVQPTPTKPDKDEDEHGHDFDALQQQLAALVEDKAKSDRAAARYVAQQRKEKQADREYAQQLIEEIQQIEEPASEQ